MAKPPGTSPQNPANTGRVKYTTAAPFRVLKPANRLGHPPTLLRQRNMLEEKMAKPHETSPQNPAKGAE
eukprot:4216292-Pyramimonas_sp.AAC.1